MKECSVEQTVEVGCYCPYCGCFQENTVHLKGLNCIAECLECEKEYIVDLNKYE